MRLTCCASDSEQAQTQFNGACLQLLMWFEQVVQFK